MSPPTNHQILVNQEALAAAPENHKPYEEIREKAPAICGLLDQMPDGACEALSKFVRENPPAATSGYCHVEGAETAKPADISAASEAPPPQFQLSPEMTKAVNALARQAAKQLTPKQMYEARAILASGTEDPILVALYFRTRFENIAKIANQVLKEKGEQLGRELGRIPETLPEYIQLNFALAAAKERMRLKAEKEAANPKPEESEVLSTS